MVWPSEVAQQLKVFVAKPDDPGLILRALSVEGGNELPRAVLGPPHAHRGHLCTPI